MSGAQRRGSREPELFLNRELSWLAFNGRVLEEATDVQNPLLERLKFATIVASNLDEFFMVRVARLREAWQERDHRPDNAGLTPLQQLEKISEAAHEQVEQLYQALATSILPALAERGIRFPATDALEPDQRTWLARFFREEVLPALTPLAIDSWRPFPRLANLSLNVAVLIEPESDGEARLAVVQVPAALPRLLRLPGGQGTDHVFLEDVIRSELGALLPGQRVLDAAPFRISRDSELELDDEGGRDFLEAVEEELRKRRRSEVVRLEVGASAGAALRDVLTRRLDIEERQVYTAPGPLDIRVLGALGDLPALDDLRDPPLKPQVVPGLGEMDRLFDVLDERDLLLHHPFESFDPVVAFVSRAADDPDVLAIKQTLYRTSGASSPLVQSLARAAESGKQVTVLVELMARFDEQSNIRWARSLEEAGAHVIYGIRGYKTHAKICMVVRRGRGGIRRYVHLATGNYNERTARLYTDMGLLTSDRVIGEDASAFFNALTGYSDSPRLKKLVMAPTVLRERVLRLIERERRHAEQGQAAEIRAKMNALVDGDIIRALYEASKAGVQIRLNVRGICCLRPGVKRWSETIEVVSIVDRFLEHTRAFHFRNAGAEEVYLSSADWMPRNLDRRIELLFPIESPDARRKVLAALDVMFQDNVKARRLNADGSYRRRRPHRGEEPLRSQIVLHREASRASERARAAAGISFEPLRSPDGGA